MTSHGKTAGALRVTEALSKDVGRGLLRMDPADLQRLGAQIGDTVAVTGKRTTVGKVMPAYNDMRGQSRVQMDGLMRDNAGVGLDEWVSLTKVAVEPAERVQVAPLRITPSDRDLPYIGRLLDGLPVTAGDRIRATLFGSRTAEFTVESTVPKGHVLITPQTKLVIGASKDAKEGKEGREGRGESRRRFAYEDVGGLRRQVQRIREMIELPLRYPQVFERLGIDAPKGVLLYGPPGCGKTLIARTIAQETEASFYSINGPEIIHKFYGESEAHLRKIFEQASQKGPSIIFLDEIDAIAPPRDRSVGDVEKRVVAQLLALMDGMSRRTNVIVIAATNLPGSIDPALRRPGRFDREIAIPIPDRNGRQEILEIHTRGMPLAADVDLTRLAEITHGFVGADLEALCREAAMLCLRRLLPDIDFEHTSIPYEQLMRLEVQMSDFGSALSEVEPSAIREVFVEIPSVRWSDVGGLDEVKGELLEAIEWPLKYPQLFRRAGVKPFKGILLSGPPGVGKTLLAKAVASECEVNFISVKGPALLSKFVGESERAVRDVFKKARQAAPCILFCDEIDALLPARSDQSSDSRVSDRVIGQFLTEMDGVEELNGVLILGATNRPDILDPACLRPGRFDRHIDIRPPQLAARQQILEVHLRGKPVGPGLDLARLAAASDGLSGAELAAICHRAALASLRRAVHEARAAGADINAAQVALLPADLDEALEAVCAQRGRGVS